MRPLSRLVVVQRALWQVLASGTGKPVRLAGVGQNAYGVAASPHGQHLVYGQRYESRNLWKIPLGAGKPGDPVRVTPDSLHQAGIRVAI